MHDLRSLVSLSVDVDTLAETRHRMLSRDHGELLIRYQSFSSI
jgi:hypothetical protein